MLPKKVLHLSFPVCLLKPSTLHLPSFSESRSDSFSQQMSWCGFLKKKVWLSLLLNNCFLLKTDRDQHLLWRTEKEGGVCLFLETDQLPQSDPSGICPLLNRLGTALCSHAAISGNLTLSPQSFLSNYVETLESVSLKLKDAIIRFANSNGPWRLKLMMLKSILFLLGGNVAANFTNKL